MSLLLLTYWLSLVYEVKKYKIKALFALGGLWNMETSFRIFLWILKPWTFFHQSYITAPNGQKVWFITCLLRLFCSSFTFKSLILCVKIFRNNQIVFPFVSGYCCSLRNSGNKYTNKTFCYSQRFVSSFRSKIIAIRKLACL